MKYPKEIVKVIDSASIDLLNGYLEDYIDEKVAKGFQVVSYMYSRHGSLPSIEEHVVTLHMREVSETSRALDLDGKEIK